MKRAAWALVLLVGIAAAGEAGLPPEGTPAPRFALRLLDDSARLHTSPRLFEGRTTLLSFFATWCKPCKKEIPEFRRLAETYGDRGFQVVLVCLDRMGVRNVKAYLEEAGASDLLVLWDKFGKVSGDYGVGQLPANLLVGPDESVLVAWEGYLPDRVEEVRRRLQALPASAGTERAGDDR